MRTAADLRPHGASPVRPLEPTGGSHDLPPVAPLAHPRTAYCRPRVLDNGQTFARLEQLAADAADAEDLDGALTLVRTAADWAWFHHPGIFVSPVLEDVMGRAAGELLRTGTSRRTRRGPRRQVLHVLTEAYELGGHTRLVRQWIDADRTSRHSVAITDQRPAPEHLTAAVRRAHGAVHQLPDVPFLERARRLAQLANQHDVVVLHIHPHDVVAAVAVEALVRQQPPHARPAVLLLNHADHVLWLGARSPDAVVNLRQSAEDVCVERRGISRDRCVRLAVPVATVQRRASRALAKEQLGLAPGTQLLLTIGSNYKFFAEQDLHLTELVAPVLLERPDAVLLAVGPHPRRPEWERAAAATGGRIQALGHQGDLRLLHEAADVYLDSYPCPSLTSKLETCLYGVPSLSFTPLGAALGPLVADNDAARDELLTAASPEEYRAILAGLLDDETAMRASGDRTAVAIAAQHGGPGWCQQVKQAYAHAERVRDSRSALAPLLDVTAELTAADDGLILLHESGAGSENATAFLTRHGGHALVCAVTGSTGRFAPAVSVVMAVTEGVEETIAALQTVIDHCLPVADRMQVVVVDNGSSDGTADVLQALAGDLTPVVLPEALQTRAAWQAGLAAATGDLALLLTNDIRSDGDFLSAMIRRLATSPAGSTVAATDVTTRRPAHGADRLTGTCLLGDRRALLSGSPGVPVLEQSARVRVEATPRSATCSA